MKSISLFIFATILSMFVFANNGDEEPFNTKVFLFIDNSYAANWSVPFDVYFNGNYIARLIPKEKDRMVYTFISGGELNITLEFHSSRYVHHNSPFTIELEPGKNYYMKITEKRGVRGEREFSIQEVDYSYGRFEFGSEESEKCFKGAEQYDKRIIPVSGNSGVRKIKF